MSANDFQIIKNPGYTKEFKADDRTDSTLGATMKPGDMAMIGGSGINFITLMTSGGPIAGAASPLGEMVGIVRKESTETASANGVVEVNLVYPMETVIRGKASDSGNIETAAELLILLNDWVTCDVSSGAGSDTTINEDEGSDRDVHGLCILTGNIIDGTLDVIASSRVTLAGPTVTGV